MRDTTTAEAAAAKAADEPRPRFRPVGDSAISIEFGDTIDDAVNLRVMALDAAVLAIGHPILETVPTYRALLVHYDAVAISFEEMIARLEQACLSAAAVCAENRLWEVPVVYGGAFGIDLESVARLHDTTPHEIVRRHAATTYRVAMIGFVPGFTYLSGLDPDLATPRLDTPRTRTPAGSISIGGAQAAVASLEAPSGWHLLGRTPVRVFMVSRDPVCIFAPGDSIRFCPIPEDDWHALALEAYRGATVARRLA